MGRCLFMRKGGFMISPLPAGYTRLEWIESTGTQYIDTGVYAKGNQTKVVADVEITYGSGWTMILGSYNDGAFFSWWGNGSALAPYYGSSNQQQAGMTGRGVLTADKNVWSYGDTSMTFSESAFTASSTMYLFSINAGGNYTNASMKLYSCQIYDDGTLVRNYVPCVSPAGAVGLYDMVGGQFYGNAGTGSFIASEVAAPGGGVLASTLSVGTVVKLMEGGTAVDYLVVNQGKPSNSSLYDDSCDGTWLLRKDCYESRAWHSSDVNDYQNSTIHSYLNSTFYDLFDAGAKAAIRQVKIPYVNGTGNSAVASGSNGLSAQIFLLSGYEVGWTTSTNQYFPVDGACLSYFSGTSTTDSKRIAYLNGEAKNWWLRSPYTNNTLNAWRVNYGGDCNGIGTCAGSYGVRPALVIPSTALFDNTTMVLKGVS